MTVLSLSWALVSFTDRVGEESLWLGGSIGEGIRTEKLARHDKEITKIWILLPSRKV